MIEPKLEKLRAEKNSYLEFQKIEVDIERLSQLITAYEYTRNQVIIVFFLLLFSSSSSVTFYMYIHILLYTTHIYLFNFM